LRSHTSPSKFISASHPCYDPEKEAVSIALLSASLFFGINAFLLLMKIIQLSVFTSRHTGKDVTTNFMMTDLRE